MPGFDEAWWPQAGSLEKMLSVLVDFNVQWAKSVPVLALPSRN